VLTGHVLKDTDYVMNYHSNNLIAPDGTVLAGTFANNPIRIQSVKSVADVLRWLSKFASLRQRPISARALIASASL